MLGLWLLVLLAVFLRIVRAPGKIAWRLLGGLWAIFLLAHLLAPARAGEFIGGTAGGWLVLGGLAALVWAYRIGLRRLRQRAAPAPTPPAPASDSFSDTELDRRNHKPAALTHDAQIGRHRQLHTSSDGRPLHICNNHQTAGLDCAQHST